MTPVSAFHFRESWLFRAEWTASWKKRAFPQEPGAFLKEQLEGLFGSCAV
jgi:hypothetical protein